MRILHLLNDVTNRGNGIVNAAVDISIEQARQGHTVAIAAARGEYESLLAHHKVQHLVLSQDRRPAKLLSTLLRTYRVFSTFQPEIVHAHMRTGLLLAWLLRPLLGFRLISHVHNVHEKESRIMGLAKRVVVVSDSVAGSMVALGIPRSKIRVVLNRILGTPRLRPLAEITPATLMRPALVTVCGLFKRKGIKELIEAFEILAPKHAATHLYIVGDGADRDHFIAQRDASPFAVRIHFEGFQADAQAYMLAADIFILASHRESFALVLIEARHAGCAIVATDVDGNAQALDFGRAGVLVSPYNSHALASALDELLSDQEKRQELQQNARIGLEQFTIRALAAELDSIYDEVLAEGT